MDTWVDAAERAERGKPAGIIPSAIHWPDGQAGGATDEVLTYTNLTRVFDTEVYVDTNALTGRLLVVPLSGRVQEKMKSD